jgi:RHS repeat-associated protein
VTSAIAVNAGTNQLSNAFYDANGNMTSGAGVTLTYDVGNRVRSASPASGGTEYYGYAADNKRMWRLKADGVTEEWTLYGKSGEKIGVYQWTGLQEQSDTQGNWTGDTAGFTALRTSLWFDGRLMQENGSWTMGDRLGTNRAGGARFLPYGEETSSTANDRVKFGTYNRDGLTGLDYADQRYYASTYGRFNSPDPYAGSAGPRVPGSWNRYMYVLGDPVNLSDRHGTHLDCDDDDCSESTDCDGDALACSLYEQDESAIDYGSLGENGVVTFSATGTAVSAGTTPASAFSTIWSGSYTMNLSGAGAFIGDFFGPVGTMTGWILGSMCGVGVTGSYVPSTKTLYGGFMLTCGAGINAGGGWSLNTVFVPPTQNPNSIANGASRSISFQPILAAGSTVTKSPGSGPPVVGPSVGSRNPVSISVSHNWCLVNCPKWGRD